MREYEYDNENHKSIIEEYNKITRDNALTFHNEESLNKKISEALNKNPAYRALSEEDAMVTGRATAFEVLYNMVGLYREGEPVSGVYLFTMLRKSNVYVSGRNFSQNLESFESMLDNIATTDKKKKDAFIKAALELRTETVPYLRDWLHKNMIAEQTRLELLGKMLKENEARRAKKRG